MYFCCLFLYTNFMMKQCASLDASFWINICAGNVVTYIIDYFYLYAAAIVAREIRYPLAVLGMSAQTALLFNNWVETGTVTILNPKQPLDWFQEGENAAMALALEHNWFLLMDDANPYHRAKTAGLKVIGSSEWCILLYDHGRLTFDQARTAIQKTHTGKRLKRHALILLEELRRYKEDENG